MCNGRRAGRGGDQACAFRIDKARFAGKNRANPPLKTVTSERESTPKFVEFKSQGRDWLPLPNMDWMSPPRYLSAWLLAMLRANKRIRSCLNILWKRNSGWSSP